MEITGRIIAVLPEQGGISKTGNEWKKQEYVLETHDQYPKKVCFQLFGADRIAQAAIQPGEELTVFFDIESREYQGPTWCGTFSSTASIRSRMGNPFIVLITLLLSMLVSRLGLSLPPRSYVAPSVSIRFSLWMMFH